MLLILQILISVLNAAVLCVLAVKLVHVLQLGGYRVRALVAWLFDRRQKFIIRLFALSLLGFGAAVAIEMFAPGLFGALGLLGYSAFAVLLMCAIFRAKSKVKFKVTGRVVRFFILLFLVCGVLSYLLVWAGFHYVPLLCMVLPIITAFCQMVCFPTEWLFHQGYLAKAKRRLFSPEFENLIRIGITGSFGKTSCKNILAAMLSEKYKVAVSPSSFNTPMGFCRTVGEVLAPEDEVLIMEMGLRYRGDIRKMAKLVRAHHAIITGLGTAHLETMKTKENIRNEKFELINSLSPDGIRVIADDITVTDLAKDIKVTESGCEFQYKGTAFKTKLLGEHNIKNILVCAVMAEKLGVEVKQIAAAVAGLKPVPHRLELIKAENGVLILDDSYNASPDGAAAAVKTLKLFKGKKVVSTPGMVELGARSAEENFKFGYRLAAAADKVIIVNEVNKDAITAGLDAGGFSADNIICVKNLEEAKAAYTELLRAGDVLLIANDLPDNYA